MVVMAALPRALRLIFQLDWHWTPVETCSSPTITITAFASCRPPRPAADAPTPSRVYVHNLPWSLTNEELANHMSAAGTVRYASIMVTAEGRSKGCA